MQGQQDQPQQHNNQDGKVNEQQQHGQQQHHEPQKCPRRYWTQGGTLRNVPVGGGCRKGKRAKTMSSTSSSRSVFIQPHQQAQDHHQSQNITHLGGSSQLGLGGGASNNLGLLHGFNAIPSYGQRHMQSQLFRSNTEPSTLFPSKDHRGMLLQPTRSSGVMTDWPESFNSKSHASATNVAVSTGQNSLWSTTIGNNTGATSSADPSINSTQWSDDLAGSFAPGPPQ
ncbi:hypothetical protein ACLB2K_007348 [Fragaria x ananassa]